MMQRTLKDGTMVLENKVACVHVKENVWDDNKWSVSFWCFGAPEYNMCGSHGLGVKTYDTKEKAIAAAKRYVKKWEDK